MRALLIGVVVVVTATGLAGPAQAQAQREIQEARRHMEEGQDYFLQERWEQAVESFMAAYELRPHTAFLYNAALAMHRMGDAERALELYQRYLQEAPNARDRADVEERIAMLTRAIETASAAPPPCSGEDCPEPTGEEPAAECPPDEEGCEETPPEPEVRITLDPALASMAQRSRMKSVILVESEPEDARIVLVDENDNEVASGTAPLEYTADPGRYALLLEHPEYRPTRTPVQVTSGRYYVFHIEMSQPPAFLQVISDPPGASVYLDDPSIGSVGTTPWGNVVPTGTHRLWIELPGYLPIEREVEIRLGTEQQIEVELERLPIGMARVLTNVEGATVEIDGQEVGQAPLSHQLEPGEHQLRVRSRGMKDYETPFTIAAGQTTRLLVRLNPRPSRTSAWVSLAFSSLIFAGAGVVGWWSTTIFDDLERDAAAGRLASDDPRIEEGFIWALAADVGFLVGTVTAALTLYYFLRDPLPESEGRVEEPVDFTENPPEYSIDRAAAPTAPAEPAPGSPVSEPPPSAPPPSEPPPEPPPPVEPPETEEVTPEAPAEPAVEEPAPEAPAPTPIQPTSNRESGSDDAGDDLSPEEAAWLYGDDEPRRGRGAAHRSRRPSVFAGGGPFPSLMIRF